MPIDQEEIKRRRRGKRDLREIAAERFDMDRRDVPKPGTGSFLNFLAAAGNPIARGLASSRRARFGGFVDQQEELARERDAMRTISDLLGGANVPENIPADMLDIPVGALDALTKGLKVAEFEEPVVKRQRDTYFGSLKPGLEQSVSQGTTTPADLAAIIAGEQPDFTVPQMASGADLRALVGKTAEEAAPFAARFPDTEGIQEGRLTREQEAAAQLAQLQQKEDVERESALKLEQAKSPIIEGRGRRNIQLQHQLAQQRSKAREKGVPTFNDDNVEYQALRLESARAMSRGLKGPEDLPREERIALRAMIAEQARKDELEAKSRQPRVGLVGRYDDVLKRDPE